MKNYPNIAIVASFFGLWMDSFLPTTFQIISGFFLIFYLWNLAGANDFTNKKYKSRKKITVHGL
jgi:hypothetical protein